jgi:hypothetical protein
MFLSGLTVLAHSTLGPSVFTGRATRAITLLEPNAPAPPATPAV